MIVRLNTKISPYVYAGLGNFEPDKEMLKMELLNIISRSIGISKNDMLDRGRQRRKIDARRLFCLFCYVPHKISYREVGEEFMYDHATVMHHIERCKQLLTVDDNYYNIFLGIYSKMAMKGFNLDHVKGCLKNNI